jgi:sortase A
MERRRLFRFAERACWTIGIVGLAAWGSYSVGTAMWARRDIERFAVLRAAGPAGTAPDLTLWSPKRIAAWQKASNDQGPVPLAVLRIPKLRLEVPVLPGTDDVTLDRAVGHIEDTALPGADGNSGIAGHRDGFFRGLKDVVSGDVIEIDTRSGKDVYRIERTWVVNPEDVSVLEPTPGRSLTLVTCYPFYFIGSAPQRFIVRAVLAGSHAS